MQNCALFGAPTGRRDMSVNGAVYSGFYGKLPARGDFVTAGLERDFIQPLDCWLQKVITGGQALLQDDWLESYLNAPIWRYALSPGACGPGGHIGVLISSVDKVGRYFPFTIAARVPAGQSTFRWAVQNAVWLHAIEHMAVAALSFTLDLEAFAARICALPGAAAALLPSPNLTAFLPDGYPAATIPSWENVALHYAHRLMTCDPHAGVACFWTLADNASHAGLFYSTGMPADAVYASMLAL